MGGGLFLVSLVLGFTSFLRPWPCSSYQLPCDEVSRKNLNIYLGGQVGPSPPSQGRGGRGGRGCYPRPPLPSPPPPVPRRLCPPPPPPPSPPPPPPPSPPSPPPPSPPPPPPPSPPPKSDFQSERIEVAFNVIQKFKPKITSDPLNITGSWVGNDVCTYQGFSCDNDPVSDQQTVYGIDFNNYFFAGPNLTLDGFLDRFPDITFFHANSNNFTGSIPEKISQLPYFFELDLSNNKYSGSFPVNVVGAANLTFLDLRYNNYSGSVPPQLFSLGLDVIFINNNKFCNPLPDNFGSTPARYLTFANNEFTGPIPSSIGKAGDTLIEVLFLNNSFDGCLPYEIGFLGKATLFDASKNKIRGPIPESFACLEKIELLNLANNQLYGPVPENICKLPAIGNLNLSNNFFTQVGPKCQELIDTEILDVSNNCISNITNQRSSSECKGFFSQQKSCPNSTLSEIPCKSIWYLNPNTPENNRPSTPAPAPAATAKQSYAYNALKHP